MTIKVNRLKKIWSGNGHLTLLIDHDAPDKITNIGWTTIVKKSSSDLDVALQIAGIASISDPVPYGDVLGRVDKSLVVTALYGKDMNQSERNSARRRAAAARPTR